MKLHNTSAISPPMFTYFKARWFRFKGTWNRDRKRYLAAIEDFQALGRILPTKSIVPIQIGWCYLQLNKQNEALAAFDRALELDPSSARAHVYKGIILSKRKQFRDASDSFARAFRMDPKLWENPEFQIHYGFTLGSLANSSKGSDRETLLNESLAAYSRVETLDPKRLGTKANIGWCLARLERFQEAVEPLEAAIKEKPQDLTEHHELGWVFSELDRNEEALAQAEICIRIDPNNPAGHWLAGRARFVKFATKLETLVNDCQI